MWGKDCCKSSPQSTPQTQRGSKCKLLTLQPRIKIQKQLSRLCSSVPARVRKTPKNNCCFGPRTCLIMTRCAVQGLLQSSSSSVRSVQTTKKRHHNPKVRDSQEAGSTTTLTEADMGTWRVSRPLGAVGLDGLYSPCKWTALRMNLRRSMQAVQ